LHEEEIHHYMEGMEGKEINIVDEIEGKPEIDTHEGKEIETHMRFASNCNNKEIIQT